MPLEGVIDKLAGPVAEQLAAGIPGFPVRVELWDGRQIGPADATAQIRLRDRVALVRLAVDPDFQFGELFTEGRLEVEGDLVGFLTAAFRGQRPGAALRRMLPDVLVDGLLRNDAEASKDNARHHYDVGNDFYALWLDERMVYTCAYFPEPESTLEEAQLAKMEHVCRKVALRPGHHVIEAGCGWGSLALHMARHHGVTVRAYNVSHEQILWAREQAEKQGLADRVEFVEDDYRSAEGHCDAFVSVGMLEHVGPGHYDALGKVIDRCLAPHGIGLIHTIGRSREQRLNRWTARRVFPNAHPPTLREMMQILEPHGLVTLDVENLRRHYELTAGHWLARFESQLTRIEASAGERVARTWRLYLAGTVASFAASTIELFQLVFTRRGNDHIPWNRDHLASGEPPRFVDRLGEHRTGSLRGSL